MKPENALILAEEKKRRTLDKIEVAFIKSLKVIEDEAGKGFTKAKIPISLIDENDEFAKSEDKLVLYKKIVKKLTDYGYFAVAHDHDGILEDKIEVRWGRRSIKELINRFYLKIGWSELVGD